MEPILELNNRERLKCIIQTILMKNRNIKISTLVL